MCPDLHGHGSWSGKDIKELSNSGTMHRGVGTLAATVEEDDKDILAYDSWCLEEFIDEHASFSTDVYNFVRFLKRRRGYERVGVVGCGWGGRQALLASYIEGPVPPRYKKFLQFNYYATAASDVIDGAMWTPPLVDTAVALSPYTVNKVDVILGRVPTLVCYGDRDRVWLRENRNAVRDWCAEKPFLEYEPQFESARFEGVDGAGYGFMWRPGAKGGVGKVSFRRSKCDAGGAGGAGRSAYGSSDALAKASTLSSIREWLDTYLDRNESVYRPPWMCAVQGNWLGKGNSKSYDYNAKHPTQKLKGAGFLRKEIAFSGVDRDEEIDWDYGWEDVEHRNEFEPDSKWDKIR